MARLFGNREGLLAVAIVVLIGLITLRFQGFAEPKYLTGVFNDTSILMILAVGEMAVILTRCIDLSVASNLALTGMVVAMLNAAMPGIPLPVLLVVSVLVGGMLGAFNGFFVWKLDIPPIVVTLGTMTIFRGLIFILSDGQWVNAHEMSAAFKAFPRMTFLSVPVLSWTAVLVVVLSAVFMRGSGFGRSLLAVGGNPVAAVYAGINVGRTRFLAFCLSGALAGISGYLWVSRYAVAYVDTAGGFELEVVAACVIGGVSIAGGVGSVAGAALGALFLGVIKNALPVINISPFWQMAITGSVIIIAVAFNARSQSKTSRLILRPEGEAS